MDLFKLHKEGIEQMDNTSFLLYHKQIIPNKKTYAKMKDDDIIIAKQILKEYKKRFNNL
jgi:hypothetical protein